MFYSTGGNFLELLGKLRGIVGRYQAVNPSGSHYFHYSDFQMHQEYTQHLWQGQRNKLMSNHFFQELQTLCDIVTDSRQHGRLSCSVTAIYLPGLQGAPAWLSHVPHAAVATKTWRFFAASSGLSRTGAPAEVIAVAGNMRLTFFSADLWWFFGYNGGAGSVLLPRCKSVHLTFSAVVATEKADLRFTKTVDFDFCFFCFVSVKKMKWRCSERPCGSHWFETPAGCIPVCTGC